MRVRTHQLILKSSIPSWIWSHETRADRLEFFLCSSERRIIFLFLRLHGVVIVLDFPQLSLLNPQRFFILKCKHISKIFKTEASLIQS